MIKLWLIALVQWVDSFASTPRQVYVLHKALHAAGGIIIYLAFDLVGFPRLGMGVVLSAGIIKEILDQSNGGSFRVGDVAWTTFPALIVFVARW